MTAIIYLLAIASAELVTALVNPIGGIVFHAALLFILLARASLAPQLPGHKLYLALALAPLIRILSLAMPLAAFSQVYWYLIITIPLLAAAFVAIRTLNYQRSDVGLTLSYIPIQLLIGVTGLSFGVIEYYILRPEPLVDALTWQMVALPAVILLLATGFTEELVFRGIIQRSSLETFGGWGLVYVAALFAVLHIGYLSPVELASAFFIGLFFGWMVRETGSLLGVTLSHGITNITLYLIVPFLL